MFSVLKYFIVHPLGRKNLFFSLHKFFFFQIYFRQMKGEYLYTWIDGCKFLVSPGETGLTGNLYLGLHEFEDMGFLLHYLNDQDFFIDIGSNVGSYTLLSGVVKKCTVVSFEPIPSTFDKLKNNVLINKETTDITVLNSGIGKEKGELFITNNVLSTINQVSLTKSEDCLLVNVNTLDSYGFTPTVIKIDVEGYEKFVIEGGENTLKNESLKVLIVEINNHGNGYGVKVSETYDLICSYGFISYEYNPFKKSFTKTDCVSKKGNNTLFLRGDLIDFVNRVNKSKEYKVNGVKI